jgi:hypothetical protein
MKRSALDFYIAEQRACVASCLRMAETRYTRSRPGLSEVFKADAARHQARLDEALAQRAQRREDAA